MEHNEVNWIDLPSHILLLIAEKLVDIKDYIRFGVVCLFWRSVYIENHKFKHIIPRQLPLLLLPAQHNNDKRSFYSLSEKRVSKFQLRIPHDRYCYSSSHGWLVTGRKNFEVSLFNPFLSVSNEIQLPPLTTFEVAEGDKIRDVHYVCKAFLSANPALNPNYVVIAVYSLYRRLAYFKPGDQVWTSLDPKYQGILNVMYCNDRFYALDNVGAVFAFDLNHYLFPKVSVVSPTPPRSSAGHRKYIAELSGDLLQIVRKRNWKKDGPAFFTVVFEVFKLDPISGEWVEVKSLDGRMLFLGNNSTVTLLASDFPECKPNRIYFTNDYLETYPYRKPGDPEPHDMGVFNLEDGSTELQYSTKEFELIHPRAMWIEPSI